MLALRLALLSVLALGQAAQRDNAAPRLREETPPVAQQQWRCPEISQPPSVSCSCDIPHTLRCTGDSSALRIVAARLRDLPPRAAVSLLDCTVQNVSALLEPLLEGVTLQGLVVSSGEIRQVSERAFTGLAGPLQALGLPSNMLDSIPTRALLALPALDRLDLSHNRLQKLDGTSFAGLTNISFLELSDNILSLLLPDAFATLTSLRTLRLRGNRLGAKAVATMRRLQGLQELDLSDNLLAGRLNSTTFSRMPRLRILDLAHNQFTSIRRDALGGFVSLASLTLHHNQIDVLEDHAFRSLGSLTQLNLAHNRIVAVSGSSLAHLSQLVQLDLSHNFLRALTADLVVPLQSLRELRLDDNDISIVTSDAMTGAMLHRLTLADNPLNCDCGLTEFATWLVNASKVPDKDRATAVCATPPSLENGLLEELTPSELLCGEDESSGGPAPPQGPLVERVPGSQVTLRSFQYDGYGIKLLWNVDANAAPYACDAIFIYEEIEFSEVLLETDPVQCNSSEIPDPRSLTVSIASVDLQPGHRYRYCLVLLEGGGKTSDELTLVLGCSEIIPLVPTSQPQAQPPPPQGVSSTTRIKELRANLTSPTTLSISMIVWDRQTLRPHCVITVEVFSSGTLSVQRQLNCSQPRLVLKGLPPGPYRVCATLGDLLAGPRGRCLLVQQSRETNAMGGLNVALTSVFVALSSLLLVGLACVTKRLLAKPKMMPTHQCFLAAPQEEQQHSRYVKLQATTKL